MKASNLAPYSMKLEAKPAQVALNPDRPVLYITAFDHGAIICDPKQDRVLRLNPTAIEMWELLSNGRNEAAVVDSMAEQYKVEKIRVAEDLRCLLDQISQHGLRADSYLLTSSTEDINPQQFQQSSFAWHAQDSQPSCKSGGLLILKALFWLGVVDVVLSVLSFHTLLSTVAKWPTRTRTISDRNIVIAEVCAAVERACVWYPGRALCLQRSAITACLLRQKGIAARIVIGVRPVPFLAHAWVEVNGAVVNDFPRVRQFYQTLTWF
jgi:hypothetical protein